MLRNTTEGWGWPTRALHWIVALMVLVQFGHGLWMDDVARSERAFQFWLHAAMGSSLLVFVAVAFVWWLANPSPREPAGTPGWQKRAAQLTHWALYALLFATMLAGWLLAGTLRDPVEVQMFGFLTLPQLLAPGSSLHEFLEEAHEIAGYLLILLAALHVAAALWHHFVLRDGVLKRMVSGRPAASAERETLLVEQRS